MQTLVGQAPAPPSPPAEYVDPAVTTFTQWRAAARATQEAKDAIGREIARQRIAGAPDAVLLALDVAMRAIPFPVPPKAEG